jgi:hypothetical protein
VFGQIKQARGFRQFPMRGFDQVCAEWANRLHQSSQARKSLRLEVTGDLIFVFVDAKWADRGAERLVFQIRTNDGIVAQDRDGLWTEVDWLKSEGVEDSI